MKKSLLFSFLVSAVALAPVAYAQDAAGDGSTTAPANGADNSGGDAGQKGKWRAAFAQLYLSDAQKQQIKQIRASTQPGKERRQQIMAVLTPDQKQKLIAMFKQYHSQQDGQ
jgi:Spy/CpxP family protein refolding chaperone